MAVELFDEQATGLAGGSYDENDWKIGFNSHGHSPK